MNLRQRSLQRLGSCGIYVTGAKAGPKVKSIEVFESRGGKSRLSLLTCVFCERFSTAVGRGFFFPARRSREEECEAAAQFLQAITLV